MTKQLLNWAVFLAVVVGVTLVAGPTSLGGPASYVIVDGRSMEPTYDDGDLVIAREASSYEVGDVITYQAPVGTRFPVIHRITEITSEGYVTQGDNRNQPDGWTVPRGAVHGASWMHIPNGGTVVAFLRQPAAMLGLLAGWITLASVARRDGRRSEELLETDAVDAHAGSGVMAETRATRAALREAELTRRREIRKTVAFIAGGALVGLSGAVVAAHASTLNVDAGVFGVFTPTIDELPGPPDPGPPEDVGVTVRVRTFNSGDGNETGGSPDEIAPVTLPPGWGYELAWRGTQDPVTCEGLVEDTDVTPADHYDETDGAPIFPTHDVTHDLCFETGTGGNTDEVEIVQIEPTTSDNGTQIQPLDATSPEDPCTDGFEDAPFCRGDSDQEEGEGTDQGGGDAEDIDDAEDDEANDETDGEQDAA